MNTKIEGLSQKQQNDCRAALAMFIEKHRLGNWEIAIEGRQTLPMGYSVKIAIAPPGQQGSAALPINQFAEVDTSDDVAAEVERLLEAAYQISMPALNAHKESSA